MSKMQFAFPVLCQYFESEREEGKESEGTLAM